MATSPLLPGDTAGGQIVWNLVPSFVHPNSIVNPQTATPSFPSQTALNTSNGFFFNPTAAIEPQASLRYFGRPPASSPLINPPASSSQSLVHPLTPPTSGQGLLPTPNPPPSLPWTVVARRRRRPISSISSRPLVQPAPSSSTPHSGCFNCLRQGHIAQNCKSSVVCKRCLKPGHVVKFCSTLGKSNSRPSGPSPAPRRGKAVITNQAVPIGRAQKRPHLDGHQSLAEAGSSRPSGRPANVHANSSRPRVLPVPDACGTSICY